MGRDLFSKVERIGDYIFTEGEHDALKVSLATSTPAIRIIKNRHMRMDAKRCLGCNADVPSWEQIDYVSRAGIICTDCHALWSEVGS